MPNRAKDKGDEAEREAAHLLASLTGLLVVRKLGAGRAEDTGDLHGVPDTTVQVAWWPGKGVLRSVREKPVECAAQQANAGATHGFTMVRLWGGLWRAVLTPEQMAGYIRETLP